MHNSQRKGDRYRGQYPASRAAVRYSRGMLPAQAVTGDVCRRIHQIEIESFRVGQVEMRTARMRIEDRQRPIAQHAFDRFPVQLKASQCRFVALRLNHATESPFLAARRTDSPCRFAPGVEQLGRRPSESSISPDCSSVNFAHRPSVSVQSATPPLVEAARCPAARG